MTDEMLDPQSQPNSGQISQKKGISGIVIKIIFLAVILGVAGAGAFFYNKAKNSPEKIIAEMAEEMGEVKTITSEVNMDIKVEEEGKDIFNISLISKSDMDKKDSENLKYQGDFDMIFSSEGMQFTFSGDYKSIGDDSYFKITTIPALPFIEPMLAMSGIDIGQMKNQWIKLNKESLISLYPEGIREEMKKEMEEKEKREKEMKEKIENILKDKFKEKKFYSFQKELVGEEINGRPAYHYSVILEKESLKELALDVFEIIKSEAEREANEKSKSEFSPASVLPSSEEFSKKFNEFLDKIGDIDAEIWIGKKEEFLYRVKFEKEINSDIIDKNSEKKGSLAISMDLTFSNFNKPMEIEAPKKYKNLDEIFQPSLNSFLPESEISPGL